MKECAALGPGAFGGLRGGGPGSSLGVQCLSAVDDHIAQDLNLESV